MNIILRLCHMNIMHL